VKRLWRLVLLGLFVFHPQGVLAAAPADAGDLRDTPWSVELRLRNYVTSHTSYEFGNPFPPNQAPLSRLEFPLDSTWFGVEMRRDFPRISVGIEALRNIGGEARGRMRDSDWDDDETPDRLSIYSSSDCRMDPSYTVRVDADLKVSDWLHLPPGLDIRPAVGFRWQRFSLTTHDGSQIEPGSDTPPLALPGDGIAFEQTYRHFSLGFKLDYRWEAPGAAFRWVSTKMQADWAHVTADNEDHHLLRGRRFTYESTYGEGWHLLTGLEFGLTRQLSASLEADWLTIRTTGSHRLEHADLGISFQFDHGVKVWSEQTSLTLGIKYVF
jgi:outer membrane protease